MKKYKFIDDLTSDVMFEAYGKTLKEVFENSAEAMFSVICQLDKVGQAVKREVEVKARDEKELLINWLQELIALVDTEDMFFSRFEVKDISPTGLKATIYGEEADPAKGETLVKAVTYYKFKFERTKGGYVTRVSLDI
jgi:SHS2 domain-containing protein